jgi:cyclophilin family peptidyl-prolyl cis-trans isomerase
MRQVLLLLAIVASVIGGSRGIAIARQVEIEVETKLLLVLQAEAADGAAVDPNLLAEAAGTIERRVDALGIEDAKVWLSGIDQIVVELPGVTDDQADEIARSLTATAVLEIIDPRGEVLPPDTIVVTTLGGPTDGTTPTTETVYETIVSGDDVQEAFATTNQFGEPTVGFTLTAEAAERFFAYTSNHIGEPLSIVVNKRVVSSPVVNAAIRDQGIIQGLSEQEVSDLVAQLNSGSLAVPLRVVTTMELTGIPAPLPPSPTAEVPTPALDTPIAAAACWTEDQRLDTARPQWSNPPAMVIDPARQYLATMETNLGSFTLELFPEDAPVAVNNFVCLARTGYYDGMPFHRIIDGFVIQGGDPTGTGTGGPGYAFADEPIARNYEMGTLAMANAGPDTNGSQFFIVVGEDGTQLPKNYTIFGQVTAGMEVVDRIAKVPTEVSERGEKSVPVEPVTLVKVTIDEA